MNFCPHRWLCLKVTKKGDAVSQYRIFATWSGGYVSGDSWRMNSGITKVIDHGNAYEFKGETGSSYICAKHSYGTSCYGQEVLDSIIKSHPSYEIVILSQDSYAAEIEALKM